MKKIYWRPSGVSRNMLLLLALFAIGGMASVETFKSTIKQKMYREKLKAAQLMKAAMSEISQRRVELVGPIDTESDPIGSGLIGVLMSEITSTSGHLASKQTTINPNWSAVMIEHFRKAKLQRGDTIAVGLSGSFPALNLATIIAAETYGLQVISIVGVTSSMWGANHPDLTWLDMERALREAHLIKTKSVAASLGGQDDRARGLSSKGINALKKSILRNQVELIEVKSAAESLTKRMDLYKREAGDAEIKAYVNVGGNTVSVGSILGKKLYREGLNLRPSASALSVDCVMSRFARDGVPVIHMIRIHKLAEKYGLPIAPHEMARVGEGRIFAKAEYNLYLVIAILAGLMCALFVFMKSDLGFRMFHTGDSRESSAHPPSPMV